MFLKGIRNPDISPISSGAVREGTGTVPSFVIPVIFVSYPDTGNSPEQPENREYIPLSYIG